MAMFNFQQVKEPLVCGERRSGKLANFQGFRQIGVVSKSTRLAQFLQYIRNTLSHIKKRECNFYTNPDHQGFQGCFLEIFRSKKIRLNCFYLLSGNCSQSCKKVILVNNVTRALMSDFISQMRRKKDDQNKFS